MAISHRKVPLADHEPYSKSRPRPTQSPLSTSPASTRRPFLTATELFFLSIFPATLLLGSLFSQISPSARHAPYSPELQAHPAAVAPSYFARKDNVLNRYFVKVGWFWITAAFSVFIGSRPFLSQRSSLAPGRTAQAILRYSALTMWWYVATQGMPFGGAPLIDRGFRWTGGRCTAVFTEGAGPGLGLGKESDLETLVTAAACRAVGGAWRGGHDVSGHAFLLILGCGLLGFEILPGLFKGARGGEEKKDESEGAESVDWAVMFAGLVGLLAWWMLLMTAAYFHTWFEKLTGLLTALTGLGAVYLLPRLVPALGDVLGTPRLS